MTLTVNNIGDNPQQPSISAQAFIPDQLIAGHLNLVTEAITVGAGSLVRGTVLGQITVGTATSAAKSGGNTGNGTLVLDVTTPVLLNATPGIYTVRCITAVTNGGVFEVKSPTGASLGLATIVAGASGTYTFSDRIKFVITDGSTDFIVGDGFDVTVAAGSGYYIKSVATATDGSAAPSAILADTADATSGAVTSGAYVMGEFNQTALTYDASWSVATLKPLLRPLGIHLKSPISATDPT